MISKDQFIETVLTFLVDFFKNWCGEYDSVQLARETFIDSDDDVVLEILLAWSGFPARGIVSDFKKIKAFEHKTLDILGACFIINLDQTLNVPDGHLIPCVGGIVEKHDQTHLNRAENAIIIAASWEFCAYRRASQGVAPFNLSVIVFALIVVLEMPHARLELSWDLHVLECFVSWPVTSGKSCDLEINGACFLFLLGMAWSLTKLIVVLCLFVCQR